MELIHVIMAGVTAIILFVFGLENFSAEVAFKLTAFAPVFIIVGFLLSFVRSKISIFGKSIFYFGFVFFCLNLISAALAPLQNEPALIKYLIQPQNPLFAILVGCLLCGAIVGIVH